MWAGKHDPIFSVKLTENLAEKPGKCLFDAMAMNGCFWEPNQYCTAIKYFSRCGCHTANCTLPGVCASQNTLWAEVVHTMGHVAARVNTRQKSATAMAD